MKPIIFLLLLTSCATSEPIFVDRSELTVYQIKMDRRYPENTYSVIWVDSFGLMYQEKLNRPEDTIFFIKGKTYAQLLRR